MKQINCIICGRDRTKIFAINNGFTLVQCLNDNLIYVNPQPDKDDYDRFYTSPSYFLRGENKLGYADYIADRQAITKNSEVVINSIRKFCDKGKLLDIGCAYGFSLDAARRHGFDVYGNDLNEQAIKYAREQLNLVNTRRGRLKEINYESELFDVAMMLGTIEHFQNPQEEVSEVQRILKPGAILAISTVNMDSIIGHGTLRPPEHLYYFSHGTICELLERNGFEVLRVTPRIMPHVFYFTAKDFIGRVFDYFYRLTEKKFLRTVLLILKSWFSFVIKKLGLAQLIIPGIDGQFLIIAKCNK